MTMKAQLASEVMPWLEVCGSCDAALPMACTCPPGDYRNILLKVWRAYEATHGFTYTEEDLQSLARGVVPEWLRFDADAALDEELAK
jgi:hypothetical protein